MNRHSLRVRVFWFIFVFLLILPALVVHASPASRVAQPDPRPQIEQLPPPTGPEEVAQRATDAPRWPWARLAFQTAQFGENWEIAISNDDGSGLRRLTHHPAADIAPALSRGGDRIAFASNRDGGDFEIYVMNADGSGLRRLTNNTTDDGRPIWSPDGRRIAFQAYRWGRAEILAINADGTGEQRLTAHDSYDGDATWSPDGTKIAFCSYRDGEIPAIFVMSSTGGPATRISTIPNSCDPVWSPDGRRIAFSSAPQVDLFYDVWVMNADGSGPRLIYDGSEDILPRSWSPDGTYIAYSSMTYQLHSGNWYLVATRVRAVPVDEPFSYPSALIDSDRAMWPSLATLDVMPPQPAFTPLPEFSRQSGYGLAWSAEDIGGSGVVSYDIETRPNAGAAWTSLLKATTRTSMARSGSSGWVEYRLRARDAAFNTSDWSVVTTRHFASQLSGRITDNRGIGLPDVTPAITPAPLTNETAGDGRYLARLTTPGNQTLTLERAGYGWVPPTSRSLYADAVQDFYLPPANNLIRNPHFEAAAGALDQWTVGGTLPVVAVTDQVATGNRAVALGLPCPQPCLDSKGELQAGSELPRLIADNNGGLVLTYRTEAGGFLRHKPAGGKWSAPEPIPAGRSPLLMTIDSAGTLHAMLADNEHSPACYSRRPVGGSWTPCEAREELWGVRGLLVDGNGVVHLLANSDYYQRSPAGNWTLIAFPEDADDVQSFVLDHNGAVQFVMSLKATSTIPARTVLMPLLSANVWGTPAELYRAPNMSEGALRSMAAVIDSLGRIHVFARGLYDPIGLYHAYRQLDGSWTPFNLVAEEIYPPISVVIDSRNMIHLIYGGPDGNRYTQAMPGQPWSEPLDLEADGGFWGTPQLALRSDDSLFAVASRSDINGPRLMQFASAPAGQTGMSTLSQSVTIPAGMSHPTLTFMKRVLGNADDGALVAVRVREGANPPQEFAIAGDARWSFDWVDMTPWRGKTVTVSFVVEQPADQPAAQLYLDSVTLGSAGPRLAARWDAPGQAQPGTEFAARLRARNNGAVTAEAAVLMLTLPDGVSLVDATPPPDGGAPLRWTLGNLSAGADASPIDLTLAVAPGVVAGKTLSLRATLSSATPAAEATHNQADWSIFIGWQSFLPGVVRTQ